MKASTTPLPIHQIVAVVVTYEPDPELLRRQTHALQTQVNSIIWVDNGSHTSVAELALELGANCICMHQNTGIAHAQNIGIEAAFNRGATHVLIMDHDSVPEPDMVNHLQLALTHNPQAAAAGPWYRDPRSQHQSPFVRIQGFRITRLYPPHHPTQAGEGTPVDHLIASGCLIHRQAWEAVGPMLGELFIDFVDVEWCLRARSLGWVVLGVWNARMAHHLGNSVTTIMGKPVHVHTPGRYYFHIRNGIFLLRQSWIPPARRMVTGYRLFLKSSFYLLFMDNRASYLTSVLKGVWDGIRFMASHSHDHRPRQYPREPNT